VDCDEAGVFGRRRMGKGISNAEAAKPAATTLTPDLTTALEESAITLVREFFPAAFAANTRTSPLKGDHR